ncbi:transposase [Dactylosporangium siamense]|uniref:Transposase n=3 Tax=Dactylosporangium siamense TaxID=685454 RepID=A0A919PWR1_9ACTN|nr:transposase [Dactylosporangium siamense]
MWCNEKTQNPGMKVVLSQINFTWGSAPTMSVTYTATLPVRDETMDFLAGLLTAERARRGTRQRTRSLSCHEQAVLVLRWFHDGTRMGQLAVDNAISVSTGYDYLHEGVDVLAARSPGLHGALLAAKAAGYSHVAIDGTLIETDRCCTPGPTPGVDLWWSGKHAQHGGNIQVITAPDGWPIWTSDVRPGREHDTTAVRAHAEILPALTTTAADLRTLGDLGYEGEAGTITVAFKKPKDGRLTLHQQQLNHAHNAVRAIAERGNALLKSTFKALRNVSLCPWQIGRIVAAALVLLHFDHARTT